MKKTAVLILSVCFATMSMAQSTVYFTKEITAESLVKIYKVLGVEPQGKVAIKISTGESSKSNHLKPEFIKPLVNETKATLVECNTAYSGNRSNTASHKKAIEQRGYTAIANVDIMDEEGDMEIPMQDTTYLKVNTVGSHLKNYNFMINLAHFKGHQMGGFGGVLKNQSIGMASRVGKALIHSAGQNSVPEMWMGYTSNQDGFLECMAAAAQSVHNYFGEGNIIYINVMNNMSVDCDCNGNPATAQLKDMGIAASLDPVALDKACLDMVFNHNSTTNDNAQPLINRINQRHGTHTVEYAEQIGLGSQQYILINIDEAGILDVKAEEQNNKDTYYNVFTIDGKQLLKNAKSLDSLPKGLYIINGKKVIK